MKDELAFNITKLNETLELIQTNYLEYKDSVESLESEIKRLESKLTSLSSSVFLEFKEKYDEKKYILINTENMMRELLNALKRKNEEFYSAVENTKDNFE